MVVGGSGEVAIKGVFKVKGRNSVDRRWFVCLIFRFVFSIGFDIE